MKNRRPTARTAKKGPRKPPASARNTGKKAPGRFQEGYLLKEVPGFCWLKKAMVGKTQEESLDLLDQWIIKKQALGLVF